MLSSVSVIVMLLASRCKMLTPRLLITVLSINSLCIYTKQITKKRASVKRSKGHRQFYSAADRNKEPILSALKELIPSDTHGEFFLEISSGSGQHVSTFAKHFKHITFQPTEFARSLFDSIDDYTNGMTNVRRAAYLDVTTPSSEWADGRLKKGTIDYIYNANMMHISEWKCTLGLFAGCGEILKPGGFLFTYGPYGDNDDIIPESNVIFHESLKAQNLDWGLRDITRDLTKVAEKNGFRLIKTEDLPANNKLLVWQKQP